MPKDYRLPNAAEKREHRRLLTEYQAAKAANERAEQIDFAAKQQVLAAGDYRSRYTGERVTDPRQDYHIWSEDDLTAFTDFCNKVHDVRTAMGLVIKGAEFCADYKTRPALHAAEEALLKWAAQFMTDPKVRANMPNALRHPQIGPKMIAALTSLTL